MRTIKLECKFLGTKGTIAIIVILAKPTYWPRQFWHFSIHEIWHLNTAIAFKESRWLWLIYYVSHFYRFYSKYVVQCNLAVISSLCRWIVRGDLNSYVIIFLFMVNGTIIPDTTSTIVTINPISKYFFLIFMQGIKPVQLFRKCILSVILGFISISFLLILFTLYFRIEVLLINVPPFFLSISCSISK